MILNLESETRIHSNQPVLYPHEFEKYMIVVPNTLERKSTLLLSIAQMPLFSVWALAIIIFAVFRKILRSVLNTRYNDFSIILLNTFGLSFGTAGESANSNLISSSEQLLLWFLSLFAMLASNLCSGMLFAEFSTSVLTPSINCLADLGKNSHIEIFMPHEFDNSTETWLQQQ